MADENTEKKDDKAKAPKERRRLVCTRPNASHSISGIAFTSVTLGDDPVHVSEHVDDDQAYERLLRIPGFTPWSGDEKAHARTIEDGLTKSRRLDAQGLPGPGAVADQQLRRTLDEQRQSNRNLAARIQELTQQNAELAAENETLREKIQALEAKGLRVAPRAQTAAAA